MCDTPAITQDVNGMIESLHPQLTGDGGQSLMGGTEEIRLLAGLGETAEWNQKDQQTDACHGRPL